jgi:hypothetical protein
MTKSTGFILVLLFAAVVAYLAWEHLNKHPATIATDDANSTDLGASVRLGGNLAPAKYGSNTAFLYPPPLAFMMPIGNAGAGVAAS